MKGWQLRNSCWVLGVAEERERKGKVGSVILDFFLFSLEGKMDSKGGVHLGDF